jgi:hypothetical protein
MVTQIVFHLDHLKARKLITARAKVSSVSRYLHLLAALALTFTVAVLARREAAHFSNQWNLYSFNQWVLEQDEVIVQPRMQLMQLSGGLKKGWRLIYVLLTTMDVRRTQVDISWCDHISLSEGRWLCVFFSSTDRFLDCCYPVQSQSARFNIRGYNQSRNTTYEVTDSLWLNGFHLICMSRFSV